MGVAEEAVWDIFRNPSPRRKGVGAPGDDCALLQPPPGRSLLQTCDQVIEGVHLLPSDPPKVYAQKLLRRCLSDLAAAGATPWAAQWTMAIPPQRGRAWMLRLAKAFRAEAEAFGLPVAGGDVSQAPVVVLTCTLLGLANGKVPGRGKLRGNETLFVSGLLGGAVSSGRHRCPEPRLALGQHLVEHYTPRAMMDLSDGLVRDLPRLLGRTPEQKAHQDAAWGADIELEELPLAQGLAANPAGWASAIGEGEDYELLVALAPRQAKAVQEDRLLLKNGLRAIGKVVPQAGIRFLDHAGRSRRLKAKGWEYGWRS